MKIAIQEAEKEGSKRELGHFRAVESTQRRSSNTWDGHFLLCSSRTESTDWRRRKSAQTQIGKSTPGEPWKSAIADTSQPTHACLTTTGDVRFGPTCNSHISIYQLIHLKAQHHINLKLGVIVIAFGSIR